MYFLYKENLYGFKLTSSVLSFQPELLLLEFFFMWQTYW